jgi:hypothetical protein
VNLYTLLLIAENVIRSRQIQAHGTKTPAMFAISNYFILSREMKLVTNRFKVKVEIVHAQKNVTVNAILMQQSLSLHANFLIATSNPHAGASAGIVLENEAHKRLLCGHVHTIHQTNKKAPRLLLSYHVFLFIFDLSHDQPELPVGARLKILMP